MVEVVGDAEAFLDVDAVRGAIEQLGTGHEGRWLREPGRIPVAGDFALGLVARASAAIEAIEGRR